MSTPTKSYKPLYLIDNKTSMYPKFVKRGVNQATIFSPQNNSTVPITTKNKSRGAAKFLPKTEIEVEYKNTKNNILNNKIKHKSHLNSIYYGTAQTYYINQVQRMIRPF
jgi:hypothetical protein